MQKREQMTIILKSERGGKLLRFPLILLHFVNSIIYIAVETKGPRVRASSASLHCGPWARDIYPSLLLVQPRKTRLCLTERLLMWRKESNQTNIAVAQWKSAWLETEGLWVWASQASLSKTHYSLLSTGSTQEDPSRYSWKIVDWDVKKQKIRNSQNSYSVLVLQHKVFPALYKSLF